MTAYALRTGSVLLFFGHAQSCRARRDLPTLARLHAALDSVVETDT